MPNSTFSRAVSPGNRLKVWNTNATVARRYANSACRLAPLMSRPSMITRPLVGTSSAPMMLSTVVFPLPDGPRTTVNSPAPTDRLTSSSAVTVSDPTRYRRETCSSATTVAPTSTSSPPAIGLQRAEQHAGGDRVAHVEQAIQHLVAGDERAPGERVERLVDDREHRIDAFGFGRNRTRAASRGRAASNATSGLLGSPIPGSRSPRRQTLPVCDGRLQGRKSSLARAPSSSTAKALARSGPSPLGTATALGDARSTHRPGGERGIDRISRLPARARCDVGARHVPRRDPRRQARVGRSAAGTTSNHPERGNPHRELNGPPTDPGNGVGRPGVVSRGRSRAAHGIGSCSTSAEHPTTESSSNDHERAAARHRTPRGG